jgi:hypothetical protein
MDVIGPPLPLFRYDHQYEGLHIWQTILLVTFKHNKHNNETSQNYLHWNRPNDLRTIEKWRMRIKYKKKKIINKYISIICNADRSADCNADRSADRSADRNNIHKEIIRLVSSYM